MPLIALFGLGLVGLGFAYSHAKKKLHGGHPHGAHAAHGGGLPPTPAPTPGPVTVTPPMAPPPAAAPGPMAPPPVAPPATQGMRTGALGSDGGAFHVRLDGNHFRVPLGRKIRIVLEDARDAMINPGATVSDEDILTPTFLPNDERGFVATKPGKVVISATVRTADGTEVPGLSTIEVLPSHMSTGAEGDGTPAFDDVRAINLSINGGPYRVPVGSSVRLVAPGTARLMYAEVPNEDGNVLRSFYSQTPGELIADRPGTQTVVCKYGVPGREGLYQSSVTITAA